MDLVTGFSVPFKAHESGSVLGALYLWGFLDLFWGFLGYSEGIPLGGTHDSLWHETFHDAHVGAGGHVGFLHLKAELGVLDQSSSLVEDLFKDLNLGLFWCKGLLWANLFFGLLEKLVLFSGLSVSGTSGLSCGNCCTHIAFILLFI